MTDLGWKLSTSEHKKFLEKSKMQIGIFDMMSDRERMQKCRSEILPSQIRLARMLRKQYKKILQEKSATPEKKAF